MVAFDAVGPSSSGANSGTSPLAWTHVDGASADVLVAAVAVDGSGTVTPATNPITAMTYNAVSMGTALLNWQSGGSGQSVGYLALYGLTGPATGSHSASATATMGANGDSLCGGSLSFASGGGSIGATAHSDSNGVSATSGSITIATTSASSIVAVFVATGSGGVAFTSGTSRFLGNNGASGSGAAIACAGATIAGTGGNVTVNWTQNSDFYGAVAVEILPPAGGGAPPPPPVPAIPPGRQSPMAFPEISIPAPALPPPAIPGSAALSGSGTLSNASVGLGVAMSGVGSLSTIPPTIVGLAGGGTGYFVDQFGKPRLVWGDAAWAWPGNAGRWNSGNWQADFDTFLSNRAAQGFTVIYCKPIGTTQSGNIDDNGSTFDSLYPFQGGSPSTGTAHAVPSSGLTSAFWARIDYMLNSALAKGITIFFNATGYATDWEASTSWGGALNNTEAQAYGAALGARYASQLNIVWNIEDDYFSSVDSKLDAFLTGLRGAGDTHLISIENMPESTSRFTLDSSPTTLAWGNTNGQYNFVYSYNQEYYGVERAYAESSPIPVIQGDGYFYQGGNAYFALYDRSFRQAAWWALTSGARGKVHGSESIWQYQSTALAASSTDWFYAHNSLAIRTLVESLANWYMLLPDTASAFVTGGRGTRASPFSSGGGGGQYNPAFTSSYVSASITVAGDLAMAYLPNSTTITIDQSKLVAGYQAWWVDPFTGAMTSATTGSTYNSTAKGNNSQGDPDWVLVFTAPSAIAGTAALSGTGTLTATPRFEAAASLSGSGTLSASPAFAAVASLSGSGTLTASPQFQATAALSGSGTLTASFQLQDSATLSGSGTLTSSPAFAGSAALSGQGTLTASPQLTGSATLAGQGSLTLALGLQATFSGQGTLTAAPRFESAVALSGAGTLTSLPSFAATAALSGSGTLTAGPQFSGAAALSGTGTLSASPRFEAAATLSGLGSLALGLGLQAVLSGQGTLTAIAGGFPSGSSMSGQGTLTAGPRFEAVVALSGTGTLTAGPQLTAAVALSGSGTLTAGPQFAAVVSLSGSGTLTASSQAAVALSGSGTLAASSRFEAVVALSGQGTLAAGPQLAAAASLSGTGTLTALSVLQGAVALSGSGTLTATYSGSVTGSAALSGSGTLASAYTVAVRATVALSGSGTLASVTVSVGILATVAAVDYPAYTAIASDYAAYTVRASDRAAYTTIATDFLP